MVVNPDFRAHFEGLPQIAGEPDEEQPRRRLPPFKQKWVDDFDRGHERRKTMWRKANRDAASSGL